MSEGERGRGGGREEEGEGVCHTSIAKGHMH